MSLLSGYLTSLAASLGVGTLLPIVEGELIKEAASQGEATIERMIELPDSVIVATCAKTGADHATALAMRDAAAKAEADFFVYLATGAIPTPPAASS